MMSLVARWGGELKAARPIMQLGVILLVLVVLASPLAVEAQPHTKIWRIGYLSIAQVGFDKSWVDAFRERLRELGYTEGQNLVIEQRHAAQRPERISDLATELARLRVDAIVAYGTLAIEAARMATSEIPIVFTVAADPVGSGYVATVARPGGNVTGPSNFHADLVAKQLELLKEAAPAASRVAVLVNLAIPHGLLQLKNIQAVAPSLRAMVMPTDVRGPGEIEHAFVTIVKARADALLIVPDPTWFLGHQRRIAQLALKNRLAAISTVREWADAGGLLSYGANFHDQWRRAANYVDKILKGAKPGDLPVEQPMKFDLVINLKTARALRINMPRSLLLRADHVIE